MDWITKDIKKLKAILDHHTVERILRQNPKALPKEIRGHLNAAYIAKTILDNHEAKGWSPF